MRSATRSASPSLSGRTAERCSSGRGMPHIMISVRLCGCWVGCRALSLLGAAALGVHQLRYALAYGAEADDAAAAQGHGYLEAGGAIVGTLLVAAFAQSLSRLAHRRGPFGSHWPVAAPVADRELGTDRGYGAQELTRACCRPAIRPDWRASVATAAGSPSCSRSRWAP